MKKGRFFPYIVLDKHKAGIEEEKQRPESRRRSRKRWGKLLHQGHGSLKIVTREGKVIYIDSCAGDGYDLVADLI